MCKLLAQMIRTEKYPILSGSRQNVTFEMPKIKIVDTFHKVESDKFVGLCLARNYTRGVQFIGTM